MDNTKQSPVRSVILKIVTVASILIWIVNSIGIISMVRFWIARRPVQPPVTLGTAIPISGTPFEHCVIKKDTGLAYRIEAGTSIPPSPIPYNTPEPVQSIAAPSEETSTAIPFFPSPTPVPTSKPTEVVKYGGFSEKNFHMVFVGSGYSSEQNGQEMEKIIDKTQPYLKDVAIDFAYVKYPIYVPLYHIDQNAGFVNGEDKDRLLSSIKTVYPVNVTIVVINTNEVIGVTEVNIARPEEAGVEFVAGGDVFVGFTIAHETGHILGLNDGYTEYIPNQIPGTELFYLDQMPNNLAQALKELGTTPPFYEAGTCNGKKVYTFYAATANIMSTTDVNSIIQGDVRFTPLQILIMNDYIAELRSGH